MTRAERIQLACDALNDDFGLNSEAYEAVKVMLGRDAQRFDEFVDATDGRFYLANGVYPSDVLEKMGVRSA